MGNPAPQDCEDLAGLIEALANAEEWLRMAALYKEADLVQSARIGVEDTLADETEKPHLREQRLL